MRKQLLTLAVLPASSDPVTPPTPRRHLHLQASAGTFLYHCEVHGDVGSEGMSGRIRVRPIEDGKSATDQVPIRWALEESTTGSRYDVRYRRGDGPWNIWKNDTAKPAGVFGRNDNPVDFNPNRVYGISARSEKRNTGKHSNWSPPLAVTVD